MTDLPLTQRLLALSIFEFTSKKFVTEVLEGENVKAGVPARLESAIRNCFSSEEPNLTVGDFLKGMQGRNVRQHFRQKQVHNAGKATTDLFSQLLLKCGLVQSDAGLSQEAMSIIDELRKR